MLRSFVSRLAPLAMCAVVAACSGEGGSAADTPTSPSPTAPSPGPPASSGCSAAVTGLPASVSADGGRFPFSIATGSPCSWNAQTDVTWADVAPRSGSGSATPELNVSQHTRLDSRTLTLTVNGQTYRVTQNAFVCTYTVDPTSLDQENNGGGVQIRLTTRDWCPWTVTASESWIRVFTPSGTGNGTIRIELDPNMGSLRRGFLTIAGIRVDVLQRGR